MNTQEEIALASRRTDTTALRDVAYAAVRGESKTHVRYDENGAGTLVIGANSLNSPERTRRTIDADWF